MNNATLQLDTQFRIAAIDRRIFGGFLEHLGRAVYEGVYDPKSPLSDENGFRLDVIDALRKLMMPVMRYPGGNFVSQYDWRDGIGPKHKRPVRCEFAWQSIEPNTFGVDEFMQWCKLLDTQAMMAVNLGTLGAREAMDLVEYCNRPAGTYWADQRIANGYRDPHDIKMWCLGNEMDGPWQAGHVPAEVYAQRADAAAKMMKGLDRSIELIICGSSGYTMPTYLEWDRKVLEYCWDRVDYISAHRYSHNNEGDTAWFLAEGVAIDRVLDDYAGLLNYVRGVKKSKKQVHISFDEWNVWYREQDYKDRWTAAPHLLEELYNFEDALVCAQYLHSFIRHADSVKMACLAQIVNVIAPIMTKTDGLLIQSIYWPIMLLAQHTRGLALRSVLDAPTVKAGNRGEVPALDVAVSYDEQTEQITVSAVNRDLRNDVNLQINIADRAVKKVTGVDILGGHAADATNTWQKPNRIKPGKGKASVRPDGSAKLTVPKMGFALMRAQLAKRK